MSILAGVEDARDLLRPTLGVAAGLVLGRAADQRSVLTSQLVPPQHCLAEHANRYTR
jgi:hypothetical protein